MTTHPERSSSDPPVMTVTPRGKLAVEASFRGQTVLTDQPVEAGGQGTAPQPFDLFLASIGTCALSYALRFCQQRQIPTDGMSVSLQPVRDPKTKRFSLMRIALRLPGHFPDKYRRAVLRAIDQCAVKRHVVEPPRVEVLLED